MATVIHVKQIKSISNDKAESLLSSFLNESTLPDSVAGQLARMQRDFRGLPPQRDVEVVDNNTENAIEDEQ